MRGIALKKDVIENNLLIYVYCFIGLISFYPFYLWPTYNSIYVEPIIKIFVFLGALYAGYNHLKQSVLSLKYFTYFLLALLLLIINTIYFYRNVENINRVLSEILYVFFIISIAFLKNPDKKKLFLIFNQSFAFILLPSLIVWILLLLNFNIPYDTLKPFNLGKLASGALYRNYYGLSIILKTQNIYLVDRLCGIFDEPGLVGTVSGLLLVANNLNLKHLANKIIFVAGLLSFSTAFYVIIILIILLKGLQKKLLYLMIVVLLIFFYPFFINMDISFPPAKRIQNAITIENFRLRGDNRISLEAKNEISQLVSKDKLSIILGYGAGSIAKNNKLFGNWSYKLYLYERGVIDVILYFVILIISIYSINDGFKLNKLQLNLIIIFVLSLYQRPDALSTPGYLIILLGGIEYLKNKQILTNYIKIL